MIFRASNSKFACDDLTNEDWDQFVASNALGHHEQSSGFGLVRQTYGFESERVVIRRNGCIVAGAQVLSQKTPIGRMASIRRGPLAENNDRGLFQEVVGELDRLAENRGYVSLVVDSFMPQMDMRWVLRENGFMPDESWRGRFCVAQRRIDTTDDEILRSMAAKGRYNTRLAISKGVEVSLVDLESIVDFYALYEMTAEHQGFQVFPKAYFEYLWNQFVQKGRMQFFLASFAGKPIAGICNTIVGDHMFYGWGGMHRGHLERKLMANYLLHFRAMIWARDHGCRIYDLGAISPITRKGVTQFKTRLASENAYWPLSMRKWYGRIAPVRAACSRIVWSNDFLRRKVDRVAWRIGLRPKLPW